MPLFKAHQSKNCCLCGASENLTGEHKIKASALRAEFGSAPLSIGKFKGDQAQLKLAQSTKSKAFHFESRLCRDCNGARTQDPDRESDRFNTAARDFLEQGIDPSTIFNTDRYMIGSVPYLNIFRYFAKLLCLHMAEVGAPTSFRLSKFALGEIAHNPVWLSVGEDWTYKQAAAQIGPHQYAAHGGLVIYGNEKTGEANAFHSTLTVGPLRYVFWSRIGWLERLEIRFLHPQFSKWCQAHVRQAIEEPLSETDRLNLGL